MKTKWLVKAYQTVVILLVRECYRVSWGVHK